MKLSSFIKEKLLFITFQLMIVIFVVTFLKVKRIENFAISLIVFSILLISFMSLLIEYIKKGSFYNNLYNTIENMENKYYISGIIQSPDFEEGKILIDILKQVTKSVNDEISDYKIMQNEYREYVEAWIHEVKLPISSIYLICENNKNEETLSILDEVKRIESFVEQALFYARSTYVEKDYQVKNINLDIFIKSLIKNHSKQLIGNKAQLTLESLNFVVFSDPKWLSFIIGQILSNSIKYKSNPFMLKFSAYESDKNITLSISDNGIGISKKDLPKIFDKGFTGDNGRKFAKSTGIGLYLCKKLCNKMHLGIDVISQENIGTTIKIIFPKDKSIILEP